MQLQLDLVAYRLISQKKKIQNAIKNKLSTYCLRWDPSVFCTKTQMSCLNQTGQSECPFTPFVLIDDRLECMDGLCQKVNTHLYNASSVDKIAAVIVFWCVATLAF